MITPENTAKKCGYEDTPRNPHAICAFSIAALASIDCQFHQTEITMKLSARNVIPGTLVEVTKGQTTAHVRIDIGGQVITASITNEAVDELKLAKGQKAHAVIKSSDVIIAVD
jgi:molybdopterin-binding protein